MGGVVTEALPIVGVINGSIGMLTFTRVSSAISALYLRIRIVSVFQSSACSWFFSLQTFVHVPIYKQHKPVCAVQKWYEMNLLQKPGPLLIHLEDFGTVGNIQIDIFARIACSCDILVKNRLEQARPAPSKTREGDIDCGPSFRTE